MKIIARNIGKRFEDNWMKSVPEDILCYRPPDAAQSFGTNNSNIRFSKKSPCDCMLFDGNLFYTLELKSVGTNSISFEKNKEDNGVIHKHQIESLIAFSKYKNVVSGFVFDFRLSQRTYFLSIDEFVKMTELLNKKSFNEVDLITYCYPTIIDKTRLKVNWRYNINKFLSDTYLCKIKK